MRLIHTLMAAVLGGALTLLCMSTLTGAQAEEDGRDPFVQARASHNATVARVTHALGAMPDAREFQLVVVATEAGFHAQVDGHLDPRMSAIYAMKLHALGDLVAARAELEGDDHEEEWEDEDDGDDDDDEDGDDEDEDDD